MPHSLTALLVNVLRDRCTAMRSVSLGEAVGLFLHRWLKAHDVTQTELSKRSGVHQSTISALIRGARGPRADHIDAVLGAIGMSLSDFAVELLRVASELAVTPEPVRGTKRRGMVKASRRDAIEAGIDQREEGPRDGKRSQQPSGGTTDRLPLGKQRPRGS